MPVTSAFSYTSPLLTRVLAVLIAALFAVSVAGVAIHDDDGADLPLGEPRTTTTTDRDASDGGDERRPAVTFGPSTSTSAPQSGIAGGSGGGSGGGTGGSGSQTGTGSTTTTAVKPGATTTTTSRPSSPSGPAPASSGSTASVDGPGIYRISPNGSDLYRVVAGGFAYPTWSPNSQLVAYGVPTATPRFAIANADGGGRRVLAEGNLGSPASFSPDSSRVAFVLGNGSSFDVHVVGVDGSGLRKITSRGDVSGVAWAPTGSLAFISGGDVWSVTTDGSNARVLVDAERAYRAVAFSPNGARIAYYANNRIWSANSDGSGVLMVGDSEGRTLEWLDLAWSPDSTRLAFHSGTGGADRIRVAGFDGTNNHVAAENAEGPDWSPDGNRLSLFTTGPAREGGDREAHLELADPDRVSFRQRVLTDQPGLNQSSGPRFSNVGSQILFTVGGADRGGAPAPAA